jgi:hypothetical protein
LEYNDLQVNQRDAEKFDFSPEYRRPSMAKEEEKQEEQKGNFLKRFGKAAKEMI